MNIHLQSEAPASHLHDSSAHGTQTINHTLTQTEEDALDRLENSASCGGCHQVQVARIYQAMKTSNSYIRT